MPVKERIETLARVALWLMVLPLLPGWYFGVWTGRQLSESPENPRNASRPELRGRLLDRAGRPLAYSQGRRRIYPYGPAAASLLGYFDVRLGTSGMEDAFHLQLQGRNRPGDLVEGAGVAPLQRVQGPDVVLTIDAELQKLCYDLLSRRRGAIVLLHVPTGELLAAASSPSYDPRRLGDDWDNLRIDPATPLFHRGLAGLYSPGSTFKVLTMIAALAEGVATAQSSFSCSGGLGFGTFTLSDSSGGGHGTLSLEEALAQSCNVTFARLGLQLGRARLQSWMENASLLRSSAELPGTVEGLPPATDGSELSTAQAAIGQGSFLVTPLAMARLTAMVARNGMDLPPRVYRAEKREEKVFLSDLPLQPRRVVDSKIAALVSKAMVAVVARGTGPAAAVPGRTVAGKTGTAENPRGAPDAWFVGFVPAKNPVFAICVLVENRGYGGTHAAPIASKVFAAALKSPIARAPGRRQSGLPPLRPQGAGKAGKTGSPSPTPR